MRPPNVAFQRSLGFGLLTVGLLALTGCGPKAVPRDQSSAEQAIRKVGQLYAAFAESAKDGLGPASVDDLKKFAAGLSEKRLTDLGLSKADVDTMFVSPRDNQPYQIQPKRQPWFASGGAGPGPGTPGKGAPTKGQPAVKGGGVPGVMVNELTGADGKRMVYMSGAQVREVDETEFQKLLSGS